MYSERMPRRRTGDLFLAVPPPANFGRRMRVVMLVDAEGLPGYLRENVFTRYRSGRWELSKPETPLRERSGAAPGQKRSVYALAPDLPHATSFVWRVEALAPALFDGFCLPGKAVTLACDGPPPLADANGAVAANGALPDTYELAVGPSSLRTGAFPQPNGWADPAYLEVPAPLAKAVSNWVDGCAGLVAAPTPGAAIRRVEDHFATNFTYRLGVRMTTTPDPLVDFMARKEGSCALFASAAALMFRSRGIPARVIGGYVCSGWNPWLRRWTVRERDGHAWVEVWDRVSERWLVADPTPPEGNPAALNKPGRARLAFDLLTAGWRRLLAYLRGASFLEVIADAGETLFLFLWHVVWSLPGFVALAGLAVVGWLRRRARRRALTPAARLRAELIEEMRRFERRAAAAPLRRRSFESWSAWLRRIGPALPPARLAAVRETLEAYQALRYRVALDEAAARVWLARVRNIKRTCPPRRGRDGRRTL